MFHAINVYGEHVNVIKKASETKRTWCNIFANMEQYFDLSLSDGSYKKFKDTAQAVHSGSSINPAEQKTKRD